MRLAAAAIVVGLAAMGAPEAWALDKQGSAHGGGVDDNPDGFDVSGAFSAGVSIVNHSYAARPDNTGYTLMRYAAHVDVDLVGERLSVPLDFNIFTDRLRGGAAKLAPSELDIIGGLTTTWPYQKGQLELGVRVESDEPVDEPNGKGQRYVDMRGRFLYSLKQYFPGLADFLHDGDIIGWTTLGWFTYNPSYYARPDNSGRALLRYSLHAEVSTFSDRWSVGLDATMFTDRWQNWIVPSELDLTPELIFHTGSFEVHLAYESDRPIQAGRSQQFLYALGVWSFDLISDTPRPLERRGEILSP